MKVKRFIQEFKPIEIKEPFKPDVLEFKDPNDFNRYYREHEKEFENISTYKLNIKYKIPGNKISQKGKKNNDTAHSPETMLIRDYSTPNERGGETPAHEQSIGIDLMSIQTSLYKISMRKHAITRFDPLIL